jgi:hypothetical protein
MGLIACIALYITAMVVRFGRQAPPINLPIASESD